MLPLTAGQVRVLTRFRRAPADGDVIRFFFRLAPPPDPAEALGAVRAVVARHEALRLRLRETSDGPAQVVAGEALVDDLGTVSASGGSDATRDSLVRRYALADERRSWDLRHDPPVRTRLVLFGSHAVLAVYVHRLTCDGPSYRILTGEFMAALQNSTPSSNPVAFSDYAEWEASAFRDLKHRNAEHIASVLLPFSGDGAPETSVPHAPAEARADVFAAADPSDGPVRLGCPPSAWYLSAASAALWQVLGSANRLFAVRVNPRPEAFSGTVGALTLNTYCAVEVHPDETWTVFLRRVRDDALRSLASAVFDHARVEPSLARLADVPIDFNYGGPPSGASLQHGDGGVLVVNPFERVQQEVAAIMFGVTGIPWDETTLRLVWPRGALNAYESERIAQMFAEACQRALVVPDERVAALAPAS